MSLSALQPSALLPSPSTQNTVSVPANEQVENGRNLEWPKAKPWLESRLKLVLDSSGQTPEKERNAAFNDIQTWKIAGPVGGRAENEAEVNDFANKFANSDMMAQLTYLGLRMSVTGHAAAASGKNGASAGIEFVKGMSESERELMFTAGATPDKYGKYEYRNVDDFYALLSRAEKNWASQPTDNGGQLSRDEAIAIARLEGAHAQQKQYLGRLTDEYNNRFGTTRTVTDIIELSGPGTKAAAKTLQSSGTDDVAHKALETLKQVGEQQRAWAKSRSDGDAKNPLEATSDSTATPAAANIAKPGSVLSIAA